jgi:hypothetical protein
VRINVKLIQRDGNLGLPQQVSQPANSSNVILALVAVADENMIH